MENATPYDVLEEKWNPVLETSALPALDSSHKRKVTAALLENTEKALREQALNEDPTNAMGGGFAVSAAASATNSNLQGYDPVLISLVRRAMPNLIAYDIAGVQPMSAPTGLIFAMRSRYDSQSGPEALFQEAFAQFSGSGNTSGAAADRGVESTDSVAPTTISGAGAGASLTRNDTLTDFRGILTGRAEGLDNNTNFNPAEPAFKEMAFVIDR